MTEDQDAPGSGQRATQSRQERAAHPHLLIVPILHTEAELGSEGRSRRADFAARHGERDWAAREAAIGRYWRDVRKALLALPIDFARVRLYQDSLPDNADPDVIVDRMAQNDSPNHRLLLDLRERGATIMGTESLALLLDEYRLIKERRATPEQLRASLLARDRHIAARIADTLSDDEVGILFIGAMHDVARHVDPRIEVALLSDEAPRNARPDRNSRI